MVFTKAYSTVSYTLVTGAYRRAIMSWKITWEQVREDKPNLSKTGNMTKNTFQHHYNYILSYNFDKDINIRPKIDANGWLSGVSAVLVKKLIVIFSKYYKILANWKCFSHKGGIFMFKHETKSFLVIKYFVDFLRQYESF